jgi:hypothetical protein
MIVVQDRFGFCFVSGVSATPEATEELSTRIGFIRETQCARHIWYIMAEANSPSRWQVLGVHFRPNEG